MKISSYSVPTIVINNRIVADRVGCVLFAYGELLTEVIKSYYDKGGDKEMTFLHVHDGGRLLSRCEKTFVEVHEKLGKPYHVINCDDSYTRTYNDFVEYFKTNKRGFFVAYRDSIAASIENAATDAGLKVPEDVEVLSLVGTKYATIVRPTLTSMNSASKSVAVVSVVVGVVVSPPKRFVPLLTSTLALPSVAEASVMAALMVSTASVIVPSLKSPSVVEALLVTPLGTVVVTLVESV